MGCVQAAGVAPPAPKPVYKEESNPPKSTPQPELTSDPKPVFSNPKPVPATLTQDSGPKPLKLADANTKVIAQRTPFAVDMLAGNTYYYCTCGRSACQPFCDGKHSGTSFVPKVFVPERTEVFYLCGCKATLSEPLCDGSHAHLQW
jgi:CDGSH-type Zn-finger protein